MLPIPGNYSKCFIPALSSQHRGLSYWLTCCYSEDTRKEQHCVPVQANNYSRDGYLHRMTTTAQRHYHNHTSGPNPAILFRFGSKIIHTFSIFSTWRLSWLVKAYIHHVDASYTMSRRFEATTWATARVTSNGNSESVRLWPCSGDRNMLRSIYHGTIMEWRHTERRYLGCCVFL